MCNKSNLVKRIFVLINHPVHLKQPYPVGLIKSTEEVERMYAEHQRHDGHLSKRDIERLGFFPMVGPRYRFFPIHIGVDEFHHHTTVPYQPPSGYTPDMVRGK